MQYTGRPSVGLNGTCVSAPQSEHLAECISLGPPNPRSDLRGRLSTYAYLLLNSLAAARGSRQYRSGRSSISYRRIKQASRGRPRGPERDSAPVLHAQEWSRLRMVRRSALDKNVVDRVENTTWPGQYLRQTCQSAGIELGPKPFPIYRTKRLIHGRLVLGDRAPRWGDTIIHLPISGVLCRITLNVVPFAVSS
ncbi:MAG: hypothetical protein QG582_1376 [Candidatus Thermoplasmatota archaeon]|nr:hypothetical protein [Candidatus Thermoplasmatota archaeon]